MSEHNFKNMWCVFDMDGKPLLFTLEYYRRESIKTVEGAYTDWHELKKLGYTCKKVNVKIEQS